MDGERADANQFFERSLGDTIVNGHEAGLRPSALYLASSVPSTDSGGPTEDRGGWVTLDYGKSGNVTQMTVRGQCVDAPGEQCTDPGTAASLGNRKAALRNGCACAVQHHYQYRWDELNRLAEARRWDRDATTSWELKVRQRYRYDAALLC